MSDRKLRLGVVFPQTEIGDDPALIKDFAQTAEALGYTHILVYDHVLGANPDRPGGWAGYYSKDDPFHEPFVLFGYLAGVTTTIELVTGVLILPQRQTALVAKQAAAVDVLSGGRLRLGIGTGWNDVEYEALNEDFSNRGARQSEQVELMRRLWAEDTVDYTGKWHRVDRASILPRPNRQIPIWFGGDAEPVLKRAARLGDGWIPRIIPGPELAAALERLDGYLAGHGRSRQEFGIEGVLNYTIGERERWERQYRAWEEHNATHVSVRTMRVGLRGAEHIEAIRTYKEALG